MKIEFLYTFIKVVESGSIKRAAEELGMAVSSVSFQINQVEKFYGAKLLKRSLNGVTLTNEGKIVLKNIKHVVDSIEQTRRLIQQSKDRVTIASGMVGIPVLHHLQTLLKAKYPNLDVNVILRGAFVCYNLVKKGVANFAIVGDLPDDFDEEHYVAEVIGVDKLVVISSPNHPVFANKDSVTLDEIKKYPMIFLTKDYGIQTSVEKTLKDLSDFRVCDYVDDFFTQIHLVSTGECLAVTSLLACTKACEVGLVKFLEIEDVNTDRVVYFIAPKTLLENSFMRTVYDYIVKNARKLYQDYRRRIVYSTL